MNVLLGKLTTYGIRGVRFVSKFRYLGHIISDDLSDDDDIRREIKNLFVC